MVRRCNRNNKFNLYLCQKLNKIYNKIYLDNRELIIRLCICIDGFLSTNDQIRRNACYILKNLESNYWHYFWKRYNSDDIGGLINYDVHLRIFSMINKYSGLSDLLDGFAILTEMAKGANISCIKLLNGKTISFMQSYLNKIYSTDIPTKHIIIISHASSFLRNISSRSRVSHTMDIINMGIKMFESIDNIAINTQIKEHFSKIIHNILKWVGNILYYHQVSS